MERGTHAELLALEGVYKNLVSRQLVSEEIDNENKDPAPFEAEE